VKSPCYCINIRRTAGAVTAYYDEMLAPSGLTVNQYSILLNLARLGESSVNGLADYVGLERTTLVRNVKPLLDRGYIEDASPSGARNRRLSVSGVGMRCITAAEPLWEKAQKAIDEKIGTGNVRLLNDLLWKIENM
jgi:DNA-binding MarR family transcriptional regulator